MITIIKNVNRALCSTYITVPTCSPIDRALTMSNEYCVLELYWKVHLRHESTYIRFQTLVPTCKLPLERVQSEIKIIFNSDQTLLFTRSLSAKASSINEQFPSFLLFFRLYQHVLRQ